jgi:hypothetical protein
LKLKECRFGTSEEIQAESQSSWHSDREGLPGSVPKLEKTAGPVCACGEELFRGWWRPICLMTSFMTFTASVWNILDAPSYTTEFRIIQYSYRRE